MNADTSRPTAAVCAHCRHLRATPDTQDAALPQAWCGLWQMIIPEPEHTGCTEFSPRGDEPDVR